MALGVGIDLGTTYTKAATCRDGELSLVALESDSIDMPAVVGITPTGLICGAAAEASEHTVRGFRSRLGDPSPILVEASPYSPETLLAALLSETMNRITAVRGERPERVVLTCPASWGPFRREQFDDVPVLAGVGSVVVVTEAQVIAARWFAEQQSPIGTMVAVFDLGGDVLEATVLRATAELPEIVGTPVGADRVAGDAFDELIAERLAVPVEQARRIKHELHSDEGTDELTSDDFAELIAPAVRSGVQSLRDAIQSSGVPDTELAAVLLAGGSVQIPSVQRAISATVHCPVQLLPEPSDAAALGAAALADLELTRRTAAAATTAAVSNRRPVLWAAVAAVVVVLAVIAGLLIGHGNHGKAAGAAGAKASPSTSASQGSGTASIPVLPIPTGTGPVESYYIVATSYQGKPEFMYEIAQRFLGNGNRNAQIFALNKGRVQPDGKALVNINKITPGWILVLPNDAKGSGVSHGPVPCCFGPTPTATS